MRKELDLPGTLLVFFAGVIVLLWYINGYHEKLNICKMHDAVLYNDQCIKGTNTAVFQFE